MRLCSLAFVSAFSLASIATADIRLEVRFSSDGGATWSRDADGFRFRTQGAIFMSGFDLNAWGLAGATLRLRATGLHASDSIVFADGTSTGRVGPFNFGAATNAIYQDGPGSWRIDSASDAANASDSAGMTFFQRDPSSGGAMFSRANPAIVFRFDVLSSFFSERTLSFELDQLSRGVATYYSSSSATRPTQTSDVTLTGGAVRYGVPAPSSFLGLMSGLTVMSRRRR